MTNSDKAEMKYLKDERPREWLEREANRLSAELREFNRIAFMHNEPAVFVAMIDKEETMYKELEAAMFPKEEEDGISDEDNSDEVETSVSGDDGCDCEQCPSKCAVPSDTGE